MHQLCLFSGSSNLTYLVFLEVEGLDAPPSVLCRPVFFLSSVGVLSASDRDPSRQILTVAAGL